MTVFIICTMPITGFSAGSGSNKSSTKKTKPTLVSKAKIQIKAKNYLSAIELLNKALQKKPQNADIYNLLGYSYRKSGDLKNGHINYNMALKIDPEHKGTLEYQGELFLMEGNMAKAKENLKKLDDICFLGCEEYDDLKEAIETYNQDSTY